MLAEPERSLVEQWLKDHGAPRRYPPGLSGAGVTFQDVARSRGFVGFFKRFGVAHVEREAFAYIARGQITVAQARAGVVWRALRAGGPMHSQQLATSLGIRRNAAALAMEVLVEVDAAEFLPLQRFRVARAMGDAAPCWWHFLPDEVRAA